MPATVKEGTFGGVSLLDEKERTYRDNEDTEKNVIRSVDVLDDMVNSITKEPFKGRISNRTFRYDVAGVSRQQDVTFDREYIGYRLLVDFWSNAGKNTVMKAEIERDIAFKQKWAETNGWKYLAVFENQVDPVTLKRLLES